MRLGVYVLFILLFSSCDSFQERPNLDLSKEELLDLIPNMIKGVDRIRHIDVNGFLHKSESHGLGEMSLADQLTDNMKAFLLRLYQKSPLLREVVLKSIDEHGLRKNGEVIEFLLELEVLIDIIASLTPILGVNSKCEAQSMAYITHLFKPLDESNWALRMLDSTGKIPDGIIADSVSFCEFADMWIARDVCEAFDSSETFDFTIPKGNTIAIGSFDGCLKTVAKNNHNSSKRILDDFWGGEPWDDFVGKHCMIDLIGYYTEEEDDNKTKTLDYFKERLVHNKMGPQQPRMGLGPALINDDPRLELYFWKLEIILNESHLKWGDCIPNGCTEDDVFNNYAVLYRNLPAVAVPRSCQTLQTQEEIKELDALDIIIICLFSFIGLLMLSGALLDGYDVLFKPKTDEEKERRRNNVFLNILRAFSFNRNGKALMNTKKIKGKEHFGLFDGMRVFSLLWVILLHVYLFAGYMYLINPFKFEKLYTGLGYGYELMVNGLPSVDTFFFMSGFLVAYLAFNDMEKKRFSIIKFYVHRYIRLTIPVMLLIAFGTTLWPHVGSGLQWTFVEFPANACRENWWTLLLYVQNFVGQDNQCLGVTWYLACDMQFFWISPLLLYPMYKWKFQNSLTLWLVFMTAATITPFAISWANNLPPTHIWIVDPATVGLNMEPEFYQRPYTRYQPYLIGMLLGLIMFRLKGKEVKINWFLNIFLWLLSFATGWIVVFGLYGLRVENRAYDPSYTAFESAFYSSFHKMAWGLALAWVTFACSKGYGGWINKFLSWGFFVPLARMSYIVYLVHLGIIFGYYWSLTYSVEMTDIVAVYFYFGLTVVAFGVGFVGTLTIELPFINLEKMAFGMYKPKVFDDEKEIEKKKLSEKQAAMHSLSDSMNGKLEEIDGIIEPGVIMRTNSISSKSTQFTASSESNETPSTAEIGENETSLESTRL